MTTQNLNTGPLRSSGHKQPTEDHATVSKMATQGEGGDPEKLLQQRILSNSNVARAALYDEADFLCVASSKKQFNVEPDNVRKILDGLLTFSRVNDPTFASGDGHPPDNLDLGSEGKVKVNDGDQDKIIGEFNGNVFIAARTAKFVLLVEATPEADKDALATLVFSFQEGMQILTL